MKLFRWVKEIRSKNGELHFKRFAIVETPWFALYVHRIYMHDRDEHLHSHPWNFKSIVLKGSYVEKYEDHTGVHTRIKKPLSYSAGDRYFFHKIESVARGPITTLFLTYGKHVQWYYKVNGSFYTNDEYRNRKSIVV